jgi:hypothetical protein
MTVRIREHDPDIEVTPQAIVWRPLKYFTSSYKTEEDDLDKYKYASFTIGNDIIFDLRVYQGHIHADVTVTLYLPEDGQEETHIIDIIRKVFDKMQVPRSAIAWMRGETFTFGKLSRLPNDRLDESEARILVLKIASRQPERIVTIDQLRQQIPNYTDLSSIDRIRSPSRPNEESWHIVVRNTISSHRTGKQTIFARGWAEKVDGGIKITDEGMGYLKSIGFLDISGSHFLDD